MGWGVFVLLAFVGLVAVIGGVWYYRKYKHNKGVAPHRPQGDLRVTNGQYQNDNGITGSSTAALYELPDDFDYCLQNLWGIYSYSASLKNGGKEGPKLALSRPLKVWDPSSPADRIGFKFEVPVQPKSTVLYKNVENYDFNLYVQFAVSKNGTYGPKYVKLDQVRGDPHNTKYGNYSAILKDQLLVNKTGLPSFCNTP